MSSYPKQFQITVAFDIRDGFEHTQLGTASS